MESEPTSPGATERFPRKAGRTPLAIACSLGDLLGDGVLHLQTGVDLDEVVLAVLVHQELHGARVLVAHLRAAP